MRNFKLSKGLIFVLSLVIAAAFFLIGKGEGHDQATALTANLGLISLTAEQKKDFSPGELKVVEAVEKMCGEAVKKSNEGKISPEELKLLINGVKDVLSNEEVKALSDQIKTLDDIAKKQGTSLTEISLKLQQGDGVFKSIGETLQENEAELKRVYQNGSGQKTFMVTYNHKGQMVMKPIDMTKAAAPHATIDGVGGGTSAITQSIDAATLLRLGGNSQIISNYRNNAWVIDLCNVINAGFELPFAMWYEEQAKQGGSDTVAEGATKPRVQYAYDLKTATYKKEAVLVGFTQEFSLDFPRLQDDIMNKSRVDLINSMNSKILANVTTAATLYNTATEFKGGTGITNVNDYDALAAMAAQVDNSTFGSMANTAVMSTFKKYRMGVNKSTQNEYVDRPSVLDNLAFIGNPDMAADAVMVGDFKQYNIIMRGGFIVRIGYNGTDFAENKFSVVMEQFYYDYISNIRKKAIVKGDTFTAVRDAISI